MSSSSGARSSTPEIQTISNVEDQDQATPSSGGTHESSGERTPLLSGLYSDHTLDGLNHETHTFFRGKSFKFVNGFVFLLFYSLCVLTGQYYRKQSVGWRRIVILSLSVISSLLFLVGSIIIIGAAVFDFYAIISCKFGQYCGYIYSQHLLYKLEQVTAPNLTQFTDWNKAVVTTAVFSGIFSYALMIWVLCSQYCFRGNKKINCSPDPVSCFVKNHLQPEYRQECRDKVGDENGVISPFRDNKYNLYNVLTDGATANNASSGDTSTPSSDTNTSSSGDTSTPSSGATNTPSSGATNTPSSGNSTCQPPVYLSSLLSSIQCIHFLLFLWLNIIVYAGSLVVLIMLLAADRVKWDSQTQWNWVGMIVLHLSQFPALVSCFIFSKITYAITNRCMDFTRCIFQVVNNNYRSNPDSNSDRERLVTIFRLAINEDCHQYNITLLKRMDQVYTSLLENSLSPFGSWFTVHWMLYTLTAFMSIAYVADEIVLKLYGRKEDVCIWGEHLDCSLYFTYTFLLTFYRCTLFLYPCFRAASVTRARQGMIKAVSRARWPSIDVDQKEAFVKYLEGQNASFKISIFCARITFGFELAYLSIVIGVVGVVLKIAL